VELLRRWKEEQDTAKELLGRSEADSDYVFTWEGQPFHPDSITSHVHSLAEKTGLDGMHTHTLRHTAASVLIGSGVDLVTVAGHLGHRDASTTSKVYAHAIERNKAKAAEALGGVIYANKNNEPE
jgi:integrase